MLAASQARAPTSLTPSCGHVGWGCLHPETSDEPRGLRGEPTPDALAETGEGFTNYLIALGIIETVALFVMVFMLGKVGALMGA